MYISTESLQGFKYLLCCSGFGGLINTLNNMRENQEAVYTLNANLSIMWVTPRSSSFSKRDPASMYTPTPENGPGRASVATRRPFERVVI